MTDMIDRRTNTHGVATGVAIETSGLGRRYGRTWALRDCTLTLPLGKVAALVGPNGAGKTTLLHLIVGLQEPTVGSVSVFGAAPQREPKAVLARVGFVAQDHPLYKGFSVEDMLTVGRKLNARWDDTAGRAHLRRLGIPLDRKVGKLSGGQQAQVAQVALALAKRPDLLVFDEPVASLDPLARREFLRALGAAAAAGELTVLLSSHIIGELEQVCDYLIILSAARVQLSGAIEAIRAEHHLLAGPRAEAERVAAPCEVIESAFDGKTTRLLVRSTDSAGPIDVPAGWQAQEPSLEEIVLAYLGRSGIGDASATEMAPALLPPAEWRSGEVAR
jgi:ABC-2 type transport system ATP-binding protein